MFSMYTATKAKPFDPHFHIVKGRNNDFLFGMHFSASLWWNGDSWGAERRRVFEVSSVSYQKQRKRNDENKPPC